MWRPRKGSTFRIPTAADSAAIADATEAFRRRASQPQDKAPVGQTIVVKTPPDGIPARTLVEVEGEDDQETIYWEKCQRTIERLTPDEKEIVETDEEIIVFNLFEQAVLGDTYVATALTEGGTRYAHLVHEVVAFTLTEDMDASTPGEASCTIRRAWSAANEEYTASSDTSVVVDPDDIWDKALDGAKGRGFLMPGNDRTVIDPIVISC